MKKTTIALIITLLLHSATFTIDFDTIGLFYSSLRFYICLDNPETIVGLPDPYIPYVRPQHESKKNTVIKTLPTRPEKKKRLNKIV